MTKHDAVTCPSDCSACSSVIVTWRHHQTCQRLRLRERLANRKRQASWCREDGVIYVVNWKRFAHFGLLHVRRTNKYMYFVDRLDSSAMKRINQMILHDMVVDRKTYHLFWLSWIIVNMRSSFYIYRLQNKQVLYIFHLFLSFSLWHFEAIVRWEASRSIIKESVAIVKFWGQIKIAATLRNG